MGTIYRATGKWLYSRKLVGYTSNMNQLDGRLEFIEGRFNHPVGRPFLDCNA